MNQLLVFLKNCTITQLICSLVFASVVIRVIYEIITDKK